jgi:alginate O-acetyltransferase complex protein AlgI
VSFVSVAFLVLLVVVLALRVVLGREARENGYLAALLLASVVFYGWHRPAYLGLIAISAAIDFSAGLLLERESRKNQRLLIVAASLCLNLGLLAFFKYADFALESLTVLLGAAGAGEAARFDPLGLVLPIGISFYTFQSMSYSIDVYRGRFRACHSPLRFMLYVSFFPQLVAGPIVRASEFLPQLDRRRRLNLRVASQGLYLCVQGFFFKLALADNLGIVVDRYWEAASASDASSELAGMVTLLFSIQIFCDFCGYSRIARGVAMLLGFRLPVNFNAPYIANSFQDFWRRWHITLSSWFRDYLYVSLGGNRGTTRRSYLNLFLVMLLGGLWHGAAWTFVIWGAIHGCALLIERKLGAHRLSSGTLRLAWAGVVQATVLVAWAFFRSNSAGQALDLLGNLASLPNFASEDFGQLAMGLWFVVPILILHLRSFAIEHGWLPEVSGYERALAAGAMAYLTLSFYGTSDAFIYFQF